MPGHAVPQKHSVPRPVYRAFGLVDRELEPFRQELGDRGHNPFTAGLGGNVDVAIVGVTAEGMTPSLQFLVEFVQKDV